MRQKFNFPQEQKDAILSVFGDMISLVLDFHELTQAEFANIAEMERSRFAKWVRGKINITLVDMIALLDKLACFTVLTIRRRPREVEFRIHTHYGDMRRSEVLKEVTFIKSFIPSIQKLGIFVEEIRKSKKMSKVKFVELVGISLSTLKNIENENSNISILTYVQILLLSKTTIRFVLFRIDTDSTPRLRINTFKMIPIHFDRLELLAEQNHDIKYFSFLSHGTVRCAGFEIEENHFRQF